MDQPGPVSTSERTYGVLAGLLLIGLPSWLTWQTLEDSNYNTILQSDFARWVSVVAMAVAGAIAVGLASLRSRRKSALGLLVLGVPSGCVAVLAGLLVDVLSYSAN